MWSLGFKESLDEFGERTLSPSRFKDDIAIRPHVSVTFATPTPSPAALIMERSFAESPTAMTSDIGIPSISARRVSPVLCQRLRA